MPKPSNVTHPSLESAVAGTFGPAEGGELCLLCPANYTTLADGSVTCDTPV